MPSVWDTLSCVCKVGMENPCLRDRIQANSVKILRDMDGPEEAQLQPASNLGDLEMHRATVATGMNDQSSRSRSGTTSRKLCPVALAGSKSAKNPEMKRTTMVILTMFRVPLVFLVAQHLLHPVSLIEACASFGFACGELEHANSSACFVQVLEGNQGLQG